MNADTDAVAVVWGNCQAEPLAMFLTEPLAALGIRVVPVPPVYLIDAGELAAAREVIARCSLLVTQPVRREYRLPGTGEEEVRAIAPADAVVVTFPVAYDSTEFPFQVVGHGRDGEGVFGPLTAYHDLRLMVAAERGWTAEKVLDGWPGEVDPARLRAVGAASLAELRRREAQVDVPVAEALGRPGAMFTVNHPSNAVIAHMAEGVLAALGHPASVPVPAHEELDHTRTPLEPAVLAAHGWPADLASGWVVGGQPLDFAEVVARHLQLYADRPDVIVDARERHAERFDLLGL